MEKKNYITPEGHKRLVDELQQLLRVERPEVCRLVQWAASNGDRSENADYLYGKKRLREIDRRVRFLNQRLDDAVVVNSKGKSSETVQFGALVTVVDPEGVSKTWRIVGVDEVDTEKNEISWQSPIGKSLLGKTCGDEVSIQTPQGLLVVEIENVRYPE